MRTSTPARKAYTEGTHRACSPEQTLETIRPFFARAGITRLADITGLDRIGIPVTLAIRPNSRTIVGSTGKGVTLAAARASGAMEAIEMFHAEYCDVPLTQASFNELQAAGHRVMKVQDLPPVKHMTWREDRTYSWCQATELFSQETCLAPFAAVNLYPNMGPGNYPKSPLQRSSNGLASGNIMPEAILAGLYEVIERDAYSLTKVRPDFSTDIQHVVALSSLRYPTVDHLLSLCEMAEVGVLVQDMTSDIEIPAFVCKVFDRLDPTTGFAIGYGCHLDTEIAISRAITEAVQARAVIQVAGSRDDTTRYERWSQALFVDSVADAERMAATATYVPRDEHAGQDFNEDTETVLSKLKRTGIDEAVAVDITLPDFPISVVRVFLPGLEGISTFPTYVRGERAARLSRAAKERST